MGKPSVKALRKSFREELSTHLDKTRAISAVGILFPGPDMLGVEHRPVRALDPLELMKADRSSPASDPKPTASSRVAARPARRLLRLAHS
jgi:hypothetical protein